MFFALFFPTQSLFFSLTFCCTFAVAPSTNILALDCAAKLLACHKKSSKKNSYRFFVAFFSSRFLRFSRCKQVFLCATRKTLFSFFPFSFLCFLFLFLVLFCVFLNVFFKFLPSVFIEFAFHFFEQRNYCFEWRLIVSKDNGGSNLPRTCTAKKVHPSNLPIESHSLAGALAGKTI